VNFGGVKMVSNFKLSLCLNCWKYWTWRWTKVNSCLWVTSQRGTIWNYYVIEFVRRRESRNFRLKEPWISVWIYVTSFCLTERPDRLWGSPEVVFQFKVTGAWSWPLNSVYSVDFQNEWTVISMFMPLWRRQGQNDHRDTLNGIINTEVYIEDTQYWAKSCHVIENVWTRQAIQECRNIEARPCYRCSSGKAINSESVRL
jgi:hypothetical protein